MNLFFDTNVLIAASDDLRPDFVRASRVFDGAGPRARLFCSAHTLAEFYAVTTRLPRSSQMEPQAAVSVIEDLLIKLSPVTLTASEYLSTIRRAAGLGLTGGIVHDSLLLACARKCKADVIYTFNERHFTEAAPDLASRIRTP